MPSRERIPELVTLLISGKSMRAAAKVLGVTAKSVSKWRKTPEYEKEFQAQKAARERDTRDAASIDELDAMNFLKRVRSDPKVSIGERVCATKGSLQHYRDIRESNELWQELQAIKKAISSNDL